jgi:hypothetical protein
MQSIDIELANGFSHFVVDRAHATLGEGER